MIERYAQREMRALFEKEKTYALWLKVECAVIRAREIEGLVPRGTAARIQKKAKIDVLAIQTIEKKLRHDVLSFVKHINDQIGKDSMYFHAGVTSYDIVDTALGLTLSRACTIIEKRIARLLDVLKRLGIKHKETMMMGRTHGVFAEPISFGQKMAIYYMEWQRNLARLQKSREEIAVGKLSGAVGNYAHITPSIERKALDFLGLKPVPVASQIIQRDRHAMLLCTLAVLAGSCEKIALQVRLLQQSEIAEVEEPFYKGQRGSSAMPHKKNPHLSERICSLARLFRGYAVAGMENIALWHERDLTNSANERFLFSHAFILLDYMLKELTEVFQGLKVNRKQMAENIERSLGLFASEKAMLWLMEKGWGREKAYDFIQKCAFEAKAKKLHLREVLQRKAEVKEFFGPKEMKKLFSLKNFCHLTEIYQRVGWL